MFKIFWDNWIDLDGERNLFDKIVTLFRLVRYLGVKDTKSREETGDEVRNLVVNGDNGFGIDQFKSFEDGQTVWKDDISSMASNESIKS